MVRIPEQSGQCLLPLVVVGRWAGTGVGASGLLLRDPWAGVGANSRGSVGRVGVQWEGWGEQGRHGERLES